MQKIINLIKEKFVNKQFIMFCIIGVCNTLISLLIYMACVKLNFEVFISSIIGDVLSITFSYFMNMHFTYHQKPTIKSAITFPISYVPGTIISAVVTLIVVDVFHGPKLWAKLIALPIYIPINYLCMNVLVKKFGGKKIDQKEE